MRSGGFSDQRLFAHPIFVPRHPDHRVLNHEIAGPHLQITNRLDNTTTMQETFSVADGWCKHIIS